MAKVKVFTEDAAENAGTWVPWRDGIEFLIRPVPVSTNSKFEKAYTRGLQAVQIGKQPGESAAMRGVEVTRKRAVYALLDSRGPLSDEKGKEDERSPGFELQVLPSPSYITELSDLLGGEVKAGTWETLDGRWTDALKEFVFKVIHLQAWISNKAEELSGHEAQEEAALSKT